MVINRDKHRTSTKELPNTKPPKATDVRNKKPTNKNVRKTTSTDKSKHLASGERSSHKVPGRPRTITLEFDS